MLGGMYPGISGGGVEYTGEELTEEFIFVGLGGCGGRAIPGGTGACRRGVNRSTEAVGTVNRSTRGERGSKASGGSFLSFPTGFETPPLFSAIAVVVIVVVTNVGEESGFYDTSVHSARRTVC